MSLYEKEKEDEGKKSKLVKSTTTKDLQTVQVSTVTLTLIWIDFGD